MTENGESDEVIIAPPPDTTLATLRLELIRLRQLEMQAERRDRMAAWAHEQKAAQLNLVNELLNRLIG